MFIYNNIGIDSAYTNIYLYFYFFFMMYLYNNHSPEATEALNALACGPDVEVKKYNTCIVNGVRFHTKDRACRRKTQNSGLMAEGNHGDNVIDFYGVVTDIFKLDYLTQRRVVLFKCEWFDLSSRKSSIHIDGDIISVNVSRTWYENYSYVLACQAKHIFYVMTQSWRRIGELCKSFSIDMYLMFLKCKMIPWIFPMMKCIKMNYKSK